LPHPPGDPSKNEEFLRRLVEPERWLAAYIYSLLARPEDAEDVLQECKILMWKLFDRFEPGTNFRAWARTIALNQILNFRRSEKRRPFTAVEGEFIEAVAAEIERRSDHLDQKTEVLRRCLRKLPTAHRSLVVWRYFDGCGVDEIAARSERSAEAVYRLLSRIRQSLNECIQRHLAAAKETA